MTELVQRKRLLRAVHRALGQFPVVALRGARQVGKSTLAQLVTDRSQETTTLYDLETTTGRNALAKTPEILLQDSKGLVIIDEVQRQPELFTLLRPICDNPKRKARFLLLGSVSPTSVRGVSESLAGRIGFIDVGGFSLEDIGVSNQQRLWLRGGFPPSYLAPTDDDAYSWFDSFTFTFLERDVFSLEPRVSPTTLEQFWRLLAHHHGQAWNASVFARVLEVSTREISQMRDVLLGTFMIRLLPPWFENLGKRLTKSSKVYLRDSGILHYLLGLSSLSQLPAHSAYGPSWEGFALEQLLSMHGGRGAYFYRTQRGTELDLLLLRNGKKWGFEFKCADAPRTTKAMHIAIDDLDLAHLWMVYPGDLSYPVSEKITALPLREISNLDFSSKC